MLSDQTSALSMKNFLTLLACLTLFSLQAQDTFSIVALDTITGEIGSAGASCLDDNSFPGSGGAIIISDILPGRGAIHTQASWNADNQAHARARMEEGLAPQEIINWLKANDAQGGISWINRQYGIVDFDPQGHPRSAALTGNGCYNWKGHRLGANYSIQGNILLGPEILDSIEARFLVAQGPLADRLMFALQGANVPGADTRCLQNGTSSLSAFLRVAKPGNPDDSLYLDLNVPSLPPQTEPIDSLQRLYNQWKAQVPALEPGAEKETFVYPNPARGWWVLHAANNAEKLEVWDIHGRLVMNRRLQPGDNRFAPEWPAGVYLLGVRFSNGAILNRRLIWNP